MTPSANQVSEEQISNKPLNITDLKTTKWLSETYYIQKAYNSTSVRYQHYKSLPILRYFFAAFEFTVVTTIAFAKQLPVTIPEWVINYVHKADHYMEMGLNFAYDKLDWWWDILMVRLIRLRDSLENLIDGMLSFGLYCFLIIGNIWDCYVSFLKLVFLPVLWMYRLVVPLKVIPKSFQNSDKKKDSLPDINIIPVKEEIIDTEDNTYDSEYESDVSAVSESWSLGYPNKVETKLTAEGKLRALMYKRVKQQLRIMRKNSVRFSQGMASYVKQFLGPKMKPAVKNMYTVLQPIAKKLGLVSTLEYLRKIIAQHPFIERQINLVFKILSLPLNTFDKMSKRRKSRRTRSQRAESLKKRIEANGIKPQIVINNDMEKTAEPIIEENVNAKCMDAEGNRTSEKSSTDETTDSSVDYIRKRPYKSQGKEAIELFLRIKEEEETPRQIVTEEKSPNIGKISSGLPNFELQNMLTSPGSPKLRQKAKINNDSLEAIYTLSPRFSRKGRRQRMEYRRFSSEEAMGSKSTGISNENLQNLSKNGDKVRKISFTL